MLLHTLLKTRYLKMQFLNLSSNDKASRKSALFSALKGLPQVTGNEINVQLF